MNFFRFKSRLLIAHDRLRDGALPLVLVLLALLYVYMTLLQPILDYTPPQDDPQEFTVGQY